MSRARRLTAVLGILTATALAARLAIGHVLAPASEDPAQAIFVVPAGASLEAVARDLEQAGLVRSRLAFEWLGRWQGKAAELRSGEYELSANLSTREILERLVSGRVRTVEVVIPEGLTAVEVAERLDSAGLADREAFLGVVRDPEVVRALSLSGNSLEGYLFPETYQLARGLSPRRVAEALVSEFLQVWEELEPRARERGLSLAEVVTLASIVEKETGSAGERPLIASVFHNRLSRGMRLESDPTTIYGIPDFDGNLRRKHLEDDANPYNTYRIPGLPPGPIANPGAESLRAVVDPPDTEYLFFVSRNDGTHHFSRSYGEHVRAVDRYQRRRR